MFDLSLIGIGTGNPDHVTQEARKALREAALVLIPRKGEGKDDLAYLRHRILDEAGATAQVVEFDYPVRDPSLPYLDRVNRWHDEIAGQWRAAMARAAAEARAGQPLPDNAPSVPGPVALLVWGDPSLYDSTLRIAARLDPAPRLRVIPGITALQALTAAHALPFNTLAGSVKVTTGRRLATEGWPADCDSVAVMLDADGTFRTLAEPDLDIWWGAYLGMEEQILRKGPLPDVTDDILTTREKARARHGWIMDTYLLRRRGKT
ncbi:precorrin-6A synthase (deacetylating) [Chachezhania sediminis]|uniref:precorrin-6A synthase (deacetylating) n=1 Tax=Chachezhania sediminis TaxID=2599291 RepID=UPI00131C8452|nr:precorrin-6A synthase (deacetylating) [Chachezhania sediminis]